MNATVTTLIELAATRFDADPAVIRPEHDLFDALGIDSFAAAELLSDVEDRFDVEIPDYELQDIKTFAALAACIDRRL